tara:strand:+ start:540 stop:764 length:225 start_codon:yes stop_codon:yes gene_type:complete
MININMTKAKEIAHTARRAARAEKFAPLDIEATIPSMATEAEAARQVIRDEDAALQIQMDAAGTPDELKALMPQ